MDKITIHKNKDEVFKCKLNIEGSSNAIVRLCLEFEDNKNLFFYGNLNTNGECVVNIPKLKEFETKSGKLFLEAVADDTYFRLYESAFELKNNVEIKVENIQMNNSDIKEPKKDVKKPFSLQVENIEIETVEPVVNPFIPANNEKFTKSRFTSWKG